MKTTYDINCNQFSKLSISSPRSSRKELKNSGQTSGTSTSGTAMPSVSSTGQCYRPVLPRLEFPSGQFDRLLRMDSKDVKSSSCHKSCHSSTKSHHK